MTATEIQTLLKLSHPLQPVADIKTLMLHQHKNTYILDENEQIVGLNLCENALDDTWFQSFVASDLQGLQALNLSDNTFTKLDFPDHFSSLVYLDVSDCSKLHTLHLPAKMPALLRLDGSDSAISSLRLPLEMPSLVHLDLAGNRKVEEKKVLSEGIATLSLQDCLALEWLDLSGNRLVSLELEGDFKALRHIYLRENKLVSLVFHDVLPTLGLLDLVDNKFSLFEENWLTNAPNLNTLYLHENSFTNLSKGISDKEGNVIQGVKDYFSSLKKSGGKVEYLREAKLIFVGNGKVGKSSILAKMLDPSAKPIDDKDRTIGLDVKPYLIKNLSIEITKLESPIDFTLNCWDFGGQGPYREVQVLFCSRKSLYLFVTSYDDTLKKEDYIGFEYWISMVRAYGYDTKTEKHSPIIHVVNKIDHSKKPENQVAILDLSEHCVKHFLEISCETGENFKNFITTLKNTLPEISDDIFSEPFTEQWMDVKRHLETLAKSKNYIETSEYFTECSKRGMSTSEASTWLGVLERIGTVIYIEAHQALNKWIFLNPVWIKDALCKILNPELYFRDATFDERDFGIIWPKKQENEYTLFIKKL